VTFLTSADIVVRSHLLSSDPPCGDGLIQEAWEGCDDGNTTPGDGCADWCQVESGWTCVGEPSVCTEDPTLVPSVGAAGVTALGAAVFGIGIVGLVIAARRRENSKDFAG
jgi:cysteine-rich repeat protein